MGASTLKWIGYFFALLCLLSKANAAGIDWTFMYQRDDIKVFSGQGSPRAYKAEGYFDANILELLAVLADVPRRVE